MDFRFLRFGAITGFAVILTGCIDNDYDLSDIDTTSEIKVNNLTLPVKIDAITLNDIFDISEDSKIQTVTVNGQEFYAVTQHGDINSQSINIPTFAPHSLSIRKRMRLSNLIFRTLTPNQG